ncbi:hypothetical protein PIB30_027146 [Stylosanthes scabra]|uniref:Uncharacterized protein n=1 Tax=Stylosanthes scabra TaxID=79078 RepID=A0ABU6Z871_9FABA|nr:hypothetical protein [Stylosanthes scabra]
MTEMAEKNVEALTCSLGEKETALGTTICHLCPGVDFSAITLDTRWNPKGRRIYNPKKATSEDSQMVPETKQPEVESQVEQPVPEDVVGGVGECPI